MAGNRHRGRSLEGTNLCATGAPNAIAVIAASEKGGLLNAPDIYMEKLVVGPTAAKWVSINNSVEENLGQMAEAFKREVNDLTIVVLDRERHHDLIDQIREAGARIRLIGDGDLSGRNLDRDTRHRHPRAHGHRRSPEGVSPPLPCAASAGESRDASPPSRSGRKTA
jgi:fructose-1,6-bisphosphatase/sedoheptulose 1,7-bisphosphatase-like protein